MDAQQLRSAYDAYNAQDLHRLMSLITDDVDWPEGDGRRLHGRAAVTEYWREQWVRTRTTDTVGPIAHLSESVLAVHVDQVVRSIGGRRISGGTFAHVVHVDNNRISRLDIVALRGAPQSAGPTPHEGA
ncbi:nuclear transport factor 2 family protein [Leifsonia sp. AK011]|uniref:nuclear transport factor 2 family protein n=1 Tax=Leifsonia sp. AK011 TaxID=2723075 RepID=UPI0015CC1083